LDGFFLPVTFFDGAAIFMVGFECCVIYLLFQLDNLVNVSGLEKRCRKRLVETVAAPEFFLEKKSCPCICLDDAIVDLP
jgi:hypothetical protein